MNYLGKHYNRKVYWIKCGEFLPDLLPNKDWIWYCIANNSPSIDSFEILQRIAIQNNLLEFKSAGDFGEKLHDFFDEIAVNMEVLENHQEISTMTTGDNRTSIADSFWECFYVTCLPETANLDNIAIVCNDLDNNDRQTELKEYIERFNSGWTPPD